MPVGKKAALNPTQPTTPSKVRRRRTECKNNNSPERRPEMTYDRRSILQRVQPACLVSLSLSLSKWPILLFTQKRHYGWNHQTNLPKSSNNPSPLLLSSLQQGQQGNQRLSSCRCKIHTNNSPKPSPALPCPRPLSPSLPPSLPRSLALNGVSTITRQYPGPSFFKRTA